MCVDGVGKCFLVLYSVCPGCVETFGIPVVALLAAAPQLTLHWLFTDLFPLVSYLYQLIFLPPTSRAAVGILICVVCCCTLNFFQPHRNRLVLFVSQMSFLMSTFKYVCAVFLRINDLNVENRKVMGWILVVLDVVFMLASVVAFVLVIQ